nr:MAG TPA: hypothetical protein [Caudoviricetes sp.]
MGLSVDGKYFELNCRNHETKLKGAIVFSVCGIVPHHLYQQSNQKPNTESNLALSVKQTNAKDCLRPSPYLHKT